jgi:hypothetical protein
MRDGLRHAAACPAPSHMECPKFRQLLRAAASGATGGRAKEADLVTRSRKRFGQSVGQPVSRGAWPQPRTRRRNSSE